MDSREEDLEGDTDGDLLVGTNIIPLEVFLVFSDPRIILFDNMQSIRKLSNVWKLRFDS